MGAVGGSVQGAAAPALPSHWGQGWSCGDSQGHLVAGPSQVGVD